jgi:hypothetical protein
MSCSVSVFSTACKSASITSVVSKWRPFSFPLQSPWNVTVLCGIDKQSPWCQRQWWTCSRLCSSLVSPFSVSVSLGFLCTARALFPKHLFNHCQGLHCTFSESCIKSDAYLLSNSSGNRVRPNTRFQIKGRKNQPSTQMREILYTHSQDMPVLSTTAALRYYNWCTDGSTIPENYGYTLVFDSRWEDERFWTEC